MRYLRLLVELLILAVLVLVLRRLSESPSIREDLSELLWVARSGPAKALVAGVDRVSPPMTKTQVEDVLGGPDSRDDDEWIYRIDDYSGYLITFANGQVVSVDSMKSQ